MVDASKETVDGVIGSDGMAKNLWKDKWYPDRRAISTSEMATMLIDTDGGQEMRAWTAENAVNALGRLIETLHEKGLLTTDQVLQVLNQQYRYEVEEDNQ